MADNYSTERIYLGGDAVRAAKSDNADMKRAAADTRAANEKRSNVRTARKFNDDSTRRDVGGLSRSPKNRKKSRD